MTKYHDLINSGRLSEFFDLLDGFEKSFGRFRYNYNSLKSEFLKNRMSSMFEQQLLVLLGSLLSENLLPKMVTELGNPQKQTSTDNLVERFFESFDKINTALGKIEAASQLGFLSQKSKFGKVKDQYLKLANHLQEFENTVSLMGIEQKSKSYQESPGYQDDSWMIKESEKLLLLSKEVVEESKKTFDFVVENVLTAITDVANEKDALFRNLIDLGNAITSSDIKTRNLAFDIFVSLKDKKETILSNIPLEENRKVFLEYFSFLEEIYETVKEHPARVFLFATKTNIQSVKNFILTLSKVL